jgi:hypothetical protein
MVRIQFPFAAQLSDGTVLVSTVTSQGTTMILSLDEARFLRDSLIRVIEADASEQAAMLTLADFKEA